MPRFLMRMDLAVGQAQLKADPDGPIIDVCSLCIVHEEAGAVWVDSFAFPIGGWALNNIKDRAAHVEEAARENWPHVYGATDWWIPNQAEFEAMNGEPYSGQPLG